MRSFDFHSRSMSPSAPARGTLLALATGALIALLAITGAPTAQAAFGVSEANFEAGTCNGSGCVYSDPASEFFTQAAGHPPWGVTVFELNHKETLLKAREPEGALKRLRVDVPPGLAADPEALPKCSVADFDADKCPADSEVGEDQLTVFVLAANATIAGKVYNLEQPPGLPLEFGIHVEVPAVANEHILLEGHVDWSGDYHEYFEINNISKSIPIVKSRLLFKGTAGAGDFLTLPSVCSSSTTSHLEVESYEGAVSQTTTHTPVGVTGCDNGSVPFAPSASLQSETAAPDQPNGVTTIVKVPQNATSTTTSDVRDVHLTLPEGLTLNPSAAHDLQACTAAQIGIGTTNAVSCPAASRVGTVTIETDLPPKTLSGPVYLASPAGGAIGGPPYTIYLDAESPYGVSVRLQGTVTPDPLTGQLHVAFVGNPQLPFSELALSLNGGARAPLANPLGCAATQLQSQFAPYTGAAEAASASPFTISGCSSPLGFALTQTSASSSASAGAYSAFTFNLTRPDGQQYLNRLSTVLPAGLLGAIPSVPLCPEPAASTGACPKTSEIGTATVAAGAGGEPYSFQGPVYLTGPYGGGPYGLSIPIAAAAGPFDFGTVMTRVELSVDEHSGRVIATSVLPTIVGGVPLRLRSLSVAVNRPTSSSTRPAARR